MPAVGKMMKGAEHLVSTPASAGTLLGLSHPVLPTAALGAPPPPGRQSRSAQKLWFHHKNQVMDGRNNLMRTEGPLSLSWPKPELGWGLSLALLSL